MSLCVCLRLGKNNELGEWRTPPWMWKLHERCHRRIWIRWTQHEGRTQIALRVQQLLRNCAKVLRRPKVAWPWPQSHRNNNVPVFSDTQIERMGVTSNLYRFLLACLNKCVSGMLWNLWKLFSVRLLDTTYATYKSTSVLFSQTLVTPPNFVCNQTQNLANTNSNNKQYLPSGQTETHRFNGNHL
jgi:hypothetical protein